MKSIIYSRVTVLGLALLCVVLDANALALGRARSAVLVGQPLSLAVPVQLDVNEDASAQCFDADVFYGDIPQERSRVTVSVSPTAQGQPAVVHITSRGIVDEPVVTVELRAGCGSKTSRRYVLLADMVPTVEAPVVASGIGTRPQPLVLSPSAAIAPPGTQVRSAVGAGAKPSKRVARVAPVSVDANAKAAASKRAAAGAASGGRLVAGKGTHKSRLQLTAIDLTVERDPVLRSTDLLVGLPLEDLEKRAQAIAAWRALNASPEDILRQDAQANAVDADLRMLKDVTAKNQKALVSLAGRLEEAQAQRYRNPLVYALALALLACLVALVFLFLRSRRGQAGLSPWWGGDDDSRLGLSQMSDFSHSVQTRAESRPSAHTSTAADSQFVLHDPATRDDGVDVDLGFTASQAASLFPDAAPAVAKERVEPSMPPVAPPSVKRSVGPAQAVASLSSINTREVLDVRQQAEFFMTLGQHDDAVHMLTYSVDHSPESNPLVYLDLLTVLHALSRKDEFERYRSAFNALFSGRVPPFAQFPEKGHRLEAYHDVCAHVVGLWPSEAAQNFIEHCLVRTNDGLVQEFDLNAFEDLLTLYGVLRRLIIGSESGFVPFSTSKSSAEPDAYSDVGAAGTADHARTVAIQKVVTPVQGVDLDLTDGADSPDELPEPSLSLMPIKSGK